MKRLARCVGSVAVCLVVVASWPRPARTAVAAGTAAPNTLLWYNQPASEWTDALPVGNGRLGAMVFGRTLNELIQLNEQTLWSGAPYESER